MELGHTAKFLLKISSAGYSYVVCDTDKRPSKLRSVQDETKGIQPVLKLRFNLLLLLLFIFLFFIF